MIEIHLRIFGLTIDIKLETPKKTPKEVPNNVNIISQEKINFSDEIEEDNTPIYEPTDIELQASKFENELKSLGIYDIPDAKDLPPTFGISDDVEIITDEFEREQEVMIERRR